MFKEILTRFRHQPEERELKFGPVSVKVDSQTYQDILAVSPIQNTEYNLRLARAEGVNPLSLREIFDQLKPGELKNTVLFDTPPTPGFAGNHWRIIGIDKEEKSATLQLCGRFGNYDNERIPPIAVPLDTAMFTGVNIQYFEIDGLPASLREAAKAIEEAKRAGQDYPGSLKYLGEAIMWSKPEGRLVTADKHPAFNKYR